MKFSKKNTAIFFIDKNKTTFLSNSQSSLNLTFPKDIYSHLELISREKLKEFIDKFLEDNKIQPGILYIILGEDATFEKDITEVTKLEKSIEIQKFLDIVPFESILSRVIKIKKREKILVANRHFCEELTDIFEEEEFRVYSIIPLSVILEINPKLKEKLDLAILFKKIGSFKKYNLLTHQENYGNRFNYSTPSVSVNPRLIVLVGFFAILVIILVFMIYTQFLSAKPTPVPIIVYTPQPTSFPTPTPEATSSALPTPTFFPRF